MLHWSIEKIILELKYTWKISRNSSDEKTNLIVCVADDLCCGNGEAAPNVRYNETPEKLIEEFEIFLSKKPETLNTLSQLEDYLKQISISNALKFAIESAFVHYLGAKEKKSIHDVLNVEPAKTIRTSYSIPIMETGEMKNFYEQNHLNRFPFIKIKIDVESGFDSIDYLSRFSSQPLLIDANEAFKDVERCIYFLEKIKKKNIEFVEQPMPASLVEESVYLKKHSPFMLFADESIIAGADFSLLKKMFDGVNIKLMKAGGYFNSIRLLHEAKKQNMKTMIGCMVESTLGISSAMNLCSLADYVDLDSFLLVKNEPYHLIEEKNGLLRSKS